MFSKMANLLAYCYCLLLSTAGKQPSSGKSFTVAIVTLKIRIWKSHHWLLLLAFAEEKRVVIPIV